MVAGCGGQPEQGQELGQAAEATSNRASVCMVTQPVCTNYPGYGYEGTFEDTADAAHADARYCRQRAAEWSHWCGNPAGVKTTTSYQLHGRTKTIKDYRAGDECSISIVGTCPNYAEYNSLTNYPDYWGYSTVNSDKAGADCKARVAVYFAWCGMANGVDGDRTNGVIGQFYKDGALVNTYAIP